YNMIIMRTFFRNSIPYELSEAAKMDGCSDFRYLLNVVLPLSKPIIAIITMYYAVAHWNSYYTEMIYLRNPKLYSLQQVMRNVLKASNINMKDITDPELIAEMSGLTDVMKYAMIVVAVIPILMIYPFIQKYFQKGVMIGSVKG
ncbi:MAG: carbohydrate ABC transporter permease, partial [Lachnospiraceae bacterium]|nr:carbohydrate ABC transporter permease [Lachnospiraceae bacterium]